MSSSNVPFDVSILIVDDEQTNLIIMEEALRGLGRIISTTDPLQAVDLAAVHQPKVTILDIEMPTLNGLSLCKQLLENPDTANTAVIFITSHNETDMEYQSFEYGAVDFIAKPIDMRLCRLRVLNQLQLRIQSDALSVAKGDLQDLLSQLPIFVSYWSPQWERRFCNDYSKNWFGLSTDKELDREASIDMVLPEELALRIRKEVCCQQDQNNLVFRYELNTYVAGSKHLDIHVKRRITDGKLIGYIVTAVDMTNIVNTQLALTEEKEWLNVTLNSIGDAVIATDVNAHITFMNPIAESMTGWRQTQAKGKHIEEVMLLCDATTEQKSFNPILLALKEQRTVAMALNCQLTSRDNKVYRVEDSAAPIRNNQGNIIGAIIVFHDVSEAIAMSVKMSHLANHDQLTDLPNRVLLHDRLHNAMRIAQIQKRRLAMLLIDIDNFKYINDTQGHHVGDLLIKKLATRLAEHCLPDFTIARAGGDEFIIIATNVSNLGTIDSFATDLQLAINHPFYINGTAHRITASIGISIYPDDADSEEKLLRYADTAMYRAKKQGKQQHCFFSQDLESELLHRHHVEIQLRQAVEHNALEVLFQPQYNLQDHAIVGCEALVRLRDTNGSLISPLDFIPIAEETGLINLLGLQVMTKSCRIAKQMLDDGMPTRFSVNVAAKQFANPDFANEVSAVLQETQLPSHLLELEVTESALMNDFETTRNILLSIKALGVSISIDDFGTGYSSLSYLKAFPIDELKIDRAFVSDMTKDEQSFNIVKTVVHLAKSLGLTLVAEGIETAQEEKLLRELECELGQGFLFSRPVTYDTLYTLLEKANYVKV
ncbi:EAL domain-containing protein [Vibrio navarrensis]|uniref:EAL domain-containing protein n=1 Tax=Vibrio navarrensis TaxID=29495 RepID=UPI00186AA26D|nr:EAL domain-containing protein [Vibrio navarrensis]MBE4618153.1 hypothetical protein [Vibrio navarrensis]